jgi:arylesterase/paraoxonase
VNSAAPADTGLYYLSTESAQAIPEKIKLLDFNPGPSSFHPLGIEYHNGMIYLLNLAATGPKIEIFRFLAKDRAATHIVALDDALIIAPNSITAISDDELIVTNDHYFPATFSKILNTLETYTALPTGSIVYIKLAAKGTIIAESKILTRLPFANGVTMLNATTLAISALTKPR